MTKVSYTSATILGNTCKLLFASLVEAVSALFSTAKWRSSAAFRGSAERLS